MHSIRSSIPQHLRLRVPLRPMFLLQTENVLKSFDILNLTSAAADGGSQDQILTKVIELVKKYDKTNTSKVTERADFQKDLSLDSLDKVELVMAIELKSLMKKHITSLVVPMLQPTFSLKLTPKSLELSLL